MAIDLTLRSTKITAINAAATGLDGTPSAGQITTAQTMLAALSTRLNSLGEALESLCAYDENIRTAPEGGPLEFQRVKTPANIEAVLATRFNTLFSP